MPIGSEKTTAVLVRENLLPLAGGRQDYDSLLNQMGQIHFVLIGEASHGTHEFY
jgi:erythromycin esterase-like protein